MILTSYFLLHCGICQFVKIICHNKCHHNFFNNKNIFMNSSDFISPKTTKSKKNMDHFVRGTCMEMCPSAEIKMREKERLLHILEVIPGTEKSKHPKADPNRTVKAFSRSAAGKIVNKTETLRPPKILLKTVSYLLFDVVSVDTIPWHSVYDFINDRLMAVRQDMVVQNASAAESIAIFQPIVRFYAFSAYKLCDESISNFDPTLNSTQLQECLKKLLCCYDKADELALNHSNKVNNKDAISICDDYLLEWRPQFESLYVIFNLGNEEALQRALKLPPKYRTPLVMEAITLSLCFRYGNFVRVCRIMKNLPVLLCAVASLFLPEIRRKAFEVMSTAYSSKNLKFPIATLQEILLYESCSRLLQDSKYYGIRDDNENLFFSKQNFCAKNTVLRKREAYVEEKFLKEDIHVILFGR